MIMAKQLTWVCEIKRNVENMINGNENKILASWSYKWLTACDMDPSP